MKMRKLLCVGIGILFTVSVGAQQPLRIVTLIEPIAFFAREIGGTEVTVDTMLPPLTSPEVFTMQLSSLQKLADADLYFAFDFPFDAEITQYLAEWYPQVDVIHPGEGIDYIFFDESGHEDEHDEYDDHEDEEHDEDEHIHSGVDPHIWLGIPEVRIVSAAILRSLVLHDPDHATAYEEGHRAFMEQLDEMDADFRRRLATLPGDRFFVHHPAFGYYARSYGLTQVALENEGRELTPRALVRRVEEARSLGIRGVITQPQFSGKNAKAFADVLDARIFEIHILGTWEQAMEDLTDAIIFSVSPQ